jgi:signal peptidase I
VRRIATRLATFLCVAALLFVIGAILLPAVLGIQRYVITGGSMTGTIPKGAVIYSKVTPAERLKVGDIITFHPPGYSTAVTHRIIAVESAPDGQRAFRTKGDFNEVADPWNPIVLNEPQQARYLFHIPLFGYVLAALAVRSVRLALIGLPALLIALSLLWSLWTQAGEELSGQLEDEGMPHDARSRA